ncbi:MAG TPA: hypothetical protein VFT98_17445 [Myxococcota bacterium]|nr:hypothetical protein [Myxococcota bacterium]
MQPPFDIHQLAEIFEVIRAAPPLEALARGDAWTRPWLERATAAVCAWSPRKGVVFDLAVAGLRISDDRLRDARRGMTVLEEARIDLLLRLAPTTVVISGAQPTELPGPARGTGRRLPPRTS